MTTKIWDPAQLSVIVGGVPIGGFAEGSMIELKMNTPRFSTVTGTTGEKVRSKSLDKGAMLTIKLMQTSSSNDILTAIAIADDLAPNGAGIFPIMLRDRSGRAQYAAAEAWIVDQPDADFDKSAKSREWKIEIAELDAFTGGS